MKEKIDNLATRPERIAAFEAQYLSKAESGDASAMARMAWAYFAGVPYGKNDTKAMMWVIRAAEAGDPEAQSATGMIYLRGVNVERNVSKAVDWLLKAARNGCHDHDVDLLLLYRAGDLNADDMAKIQAAAKAGDLRSYTGEVVRFKPDKTPPPSKAAPDLAEAEPQYALQSLQSGAMAGKIGAQYELGLALLYGCGVAADANQARQWLEMAAMQVADADMALGDIYQTGKLGTPDPVQAAHWYGIAGAMGNSEGARNAAAIYLRQEGPAYDPIKAYGMALAIQMHGQSDPSDLFARLRPQLSPEQRADALEWICTLMLQHARVAGPH